MKFTKKKFISTCLLLILFFIQGTINSQESEVYKIYKEKYPNTHSVRLLERTEIDITLEDSEIVIRESRTEEDLYLDEAATYGSKRSIDYSTFFQMESIKASSFVYEKNKYKEIKVKDFIEKDKFSKSFYDDTKSISFIYSNLQNGGKSKLEYTQLIKNPRFLSGFYFGSFSPIINKEVVIKVDKEITLDFKKFNIEKVTLDFSKEEKRGKIIYRWKATNIAEYDTEESTPNFRNIFPHIVPIITEYKVKDEVIPLLKDVSGLYKWYYSLVENINKEEKNENLIALVEELTKDKKTELEKVRAIYYWVQNNIKYIAFEYALGGFIPREANDVYQKKYGDCKDNSSILYEMLDIAGIKGSLTWIGTRSIPYRYEEVPTPVVDNHMILTYENGEKTYFLDATGRFIPLEMPTSFIQGKEALVGKNKDEYEIKKVPVIEASRNKFEDSISIKIKDKKIVGIGKAKFTGYQKIDVYNRLEGKKNNEEEIKFYGYYLEKANNTFLVDSVTEINKYDYDKEFAVIYDFHVDDYVTEVEDEIYINLNLNRSLSGLKTKKDRKHAKEFRYKNQDIYTTVLEIPATKKVQYLPENFTIENDFFKASITYKQLANKIIYTHSMTFDFLELDTQQLEELNVMIKKTDKMYKEVIVLENK